MFRLKVKKLIDEYGIKKEYLIELISSNRVTFPKKLKGEIEFTDEEKQLITNKYGTLL
jgi:hypothetical protein